MTRELPVVKAPEPGSRAGTVVGILLAAGEASRFGDANKLLAELDGEPVVARAARSLLASGLDRVVAVVGADADRVRGALEGLDVEVVENPDFEAGKATSVVRGVEAVRGDDPAAVVLALGDMPRVSPASVDALVDAHAAGLGTALAAAYRGERGNPVLFDRRFLDALAGLAGPGGALDVLLGAEGAALVETDDPGVREDVDTPADLEGLR